MCGIIGYIGDKDSPPILLQGLKRMEYRGYDSAGIAVIQNGEVNIAKVSGNISKLQSKLEKIDIHGSVGLGHTRWATHGGPTEVNAHPHADVTSKIVIVHNGIIENYYSLRQELLNKGYQFKTETDSEVLVNLVSEMYEGDIEEAVKLALSQVKGTYGLAVLCYDEPDKLIAARMGSPLVLGIGTHQNFIASDLAAVVEHTRNVIFLDDGDLAVVTANDITHSRLDHKLSNKKVERISFSIEQIEKGGYPHFMLKEIYEQSNSIRDAMRGRLIEDQGTAQLGGLLDSEDDLRRMKRITIVACGTSWHAGLIGKYLIEEMAKIPVNVEYASEFRYRNPVIEPNTMTIAISQSGETIDTLEAMREALRRGSNGFAICNVVGSTIARESTAGVYIHAGPEIGVASTKAFTAQITVLCLFALKLARQNGMTLEEGQEFVREMKKIPRKVNQILNNSSQIHEIAEMFKNRNHALYLSRGINYPVALEGALKLKEISYIHAEGYPAAEMKHGPIALIDENMPVFFIAVSGNMYEKVLNNIEQVRSRKGIVIAVVNEDGSEIDRYVDHIIRIPRTHRFLSPLLTVIPLQLLAYHIAVLRECNVDQPRNLAKSVTVE